MMKAFGKGGTSPAISKSSCPSSRWPTDEEVAEHAGDLGTLGGPKAESGEAPEREAAAASRSGTGCAPKGLELGERSTHAHASAAARQLEG